MIRRNLLSSTDMSTSLSLGVVAKRSRSIVGLRLSTMLSLTLNRFGQGVNCASEFLTRPLDVDMDVHFVDTWKGFPIRLRQTWPEIVHPRSNL